MVDKRIKNLPITPMPKKIKPMLASLIKEPFSSNGWIFEIKWDGYRVIAEVDNKNVNLYSRNLLSLNDKFKSIVKELEKFNISSALFDGEIVVLDKKGYSNFQALQNYSVEKGPLIYFIFDLLYLEGRDLRNLKLLKRKEILKSLLERKSDFIKFNDHIEREGKIFFNKVKEHGIEGIVAKEKISNYIFGIRTKKWLKIKTNLRQEAVIVGFTEPKGVRKYFGSLVLAANEKNNLIYIGRVGSGFNDKELRKINKLITGLELNELFLINAPKLNETIHWIRPLLVCEIKFTEWTKENIMRQPVYLGLREDKPAKEVKIEKPIRWK